MLRTVLGFTAVAVAVAIAFVGCGRSPLAPFDQAGFPAEDPISQRCDKVDYLFVIDNSASMADNQRKLVENYEGFIAGVEQSGRSVGDLHLGVVTTDRYAHSDPPCRTLGGLVTRAADGRRCGPFADGFNFITERDAIREAFACAAAVGTGGSTAEQPLSAAARAVGSELGAPGECNEHFIRDDALLVMVIVTDEDQPGSTEELYENVVGAKHGYADNVVVISFINEPGGSCGLGGHASISANISRFTQLFDHGFNAPICADSYEPAFAQAVEVVEQACGKS